MGINTTEVENNDKVYSTYNETTKTTKKTGSYGKTIGEATLSEEGQKYYEELKKKYGNMDFILVSKDMKEQAKSQAGSYANPTKTVVLIDEEKIERMATDENYRKQYEGIIQNASSGLSQLKQSLSTSGAKVQGYGMTVNDGGTASFFAVLEKSTEAQKDRIEKKAAEKKADKKAEEKKANKKKQEESIKESSKESDTVTISANSIEELLQKIQDYTYEDMSNNVQTEQEKLVGQNFDFKG